MNNAISQEAEVKEVAFASGRLTRAPARRTSSGRGALAVPRRLEDPTVLIPRPRRRIG